MKGSMATAGCNFCLRRGNSFILGTFNVLSHIRNSKMRLGEREKNAVVKHVGIFIPAT